MTKSLVNQVCVKFDLYDKIKEAQQKDDQTTKNIEKVRKGETQYFTIERGLLRREPVIYTA